MYAYKKLLHLKPNRRESIAAGRCYFYGMSTSPASASTKKLVCRREIDWGIEKIRPCTLDVIVSQPTSRIERDTLHSMASFALAVDSGGTLPNGDGFRSNTYRAFCALMKKTNLEALPQFRFDCTISLR